MTMGDLIIIGDCAIDPSAETETRSCVQGIQCAKKVRR